MCDLNLNRQPEKILTIAMPSYNMSDYVDRSISSIAACSKLSNIELLVINDGSTDSTAERASCYCNQYPESIFLVNKENGHYGSAVNLAMQVAKGRYFKILDADDEYSPKGLSDLVSFLESSDLVDMVISDYETEYEETGETERTSFDLSPKCVTRFDNTEALRPVGMHALTFRTDMLRQAQIRLDEGVAFTDAEYMLYPIPEVETIAYLPALVYSYKIGRSGQSADLTNVDKNMFSHTTVVRSCLDWFEHIFLTLSMTKKCYIAARIAGLVDDHVYRCLISNDPYEYLNDLKEICSGSFFDKVICPRCKSHALRILLKTNFCVYAPLCWYMRKRTNIKK